MGFPKLDDAIREGYVPNLRDLAGNLSWSTRMPNSVLQVDEDDVVITLFLSFTREPFGVTTIFCLDLR